MKKIISFFLVFLVFASLALAVSVTTDKKDYARGEIVKISIGGCLATSILQISNANKPIPDMVAVEEGKGSWQATYNTNSDVSKGNYTIFVSCEDKTTATAYFCVEAGCTTSITTTTQQPATTVTVPSGGGRSSCLSNWSCSTWSYCGRDLRQTRSCTDKNWCQVAKTENRSCLACEEAWVCTQWSNCINSGQTRTCYEEHNCGTMLKKPAESQACTTAPSYVPTYTPPKYVPPQQQYVPPQKQMPAPTFWDKYGSWLITLLAILLVTGGSLFYYLYFYKHRKGAAVNLNELKSWAGKELQRGVSKEQLKGAIKGTSWNEQELSQVFRELDRERLK